MLKLCQEKFYPKDFLFGFKLIWFTFVVGAGKLDFDVLSGSEIMFFEKKVEIYGKKLFKKKIGEKFELISHKSLVLMQYKTFVKQFLRVWDFFWDSF